MGIVYWIGGAKPIAQVATVQITGFDSGTTYNLTVTDEAGRTHVVSTVGVSNVNTTATNLNTAWNADNNPAVDRVTATVSTDTITLRADNIGQPFTIASSKTSGSGTIGSVTVTTASSGPNDYGIAENWYESAYHVPGAGDDVVIGPEAQSSILYGLNQSSVDLNSFCVKEGVGVQLGGTDGGYLKLGFASGGKVIDFNGTGQAWVHVGANPVSPIIRNTAQPSQGLHGLYLAGTDVANIYLYRGNVGFGVSPDDTTSECNNFYVSNLGRPATDSHLTIGPHVQNTSGAAITLIQKFGGSVICHGTTGVTAVKQKSPSRDPADGGYFEATKDCGAIATFTNDAGLADLSNTDAGTTCNVNGGVVDMTKENTTRTWTNVKLNPRVGGWAIFRRDPNVVTVTNGVESDDRVELTAT